MPDRPDPARLLTLAILRCVADTNDRGPGFDAAVALVRDGLEGERDRGRTEGVGVMILASGATPLQTVDASEPHH
jgi:hypothetical protein